MKTSREQRFRSLATLVTPDVAAYLRRRLYPLGLDDLDDLVEEVLLVLWRRLDDVPEGAELPWAIGVARNVRRNAARKFQRADDYVKSQRPSSVTPSAEDLVIADEGVRVALGAMSETDREVLLLAVWDGRSVEDIATILGITSNAAAVRLTRAKDRFRRHFDHAMVG